MGKDDVNWKQTVITIVLTGVVTLAVSLAIGYYQSEEPILSYSVASSLPFEEEDSYLSIYHIVIENQGKNQISDVVGFIDTSGSQIVSKQVSADPTLNYKDNITHDAYKIESVSLNPNERIEISLLVSSISPLFEPQISVRGSGVTGTVQSTVEDKSFFEFLILPLSIAVLFMLVSSKIFSKKYVETRDKPKYDQGSRADNLAYLCSMNGLFEEAEYFSKNKITYRNAADYLSLKAIKNENPEKRNQIKKMLENLLAYADDLIAESSKGVIYFNIARIEAFEGNSDKVTHNIMKSKEYNLLEIERRLKIDPLFSENEELIEMLKS